MPESTSKLITTISNHIYLQIRNIYNFITQYKRSRYQVEADLKEFKEIQQRSLKYTDFSDHLTTLFAEAVSNQPKLIVELGTRGGDSTFVLERVAKLCDADLVSVDIVDCKNVSQYPKWHFVQNDDIKFAAEFNKWCLERRLPAEVDVLFIDTSHEYQHTRQEIEAWFPHLSGKAKVIFHDTNLRKIYFRKDGTMGIGWNNRRGVIKALEEYLDIIVDENQDFITVRNKWLIKHWSNCSGFTVIERLILRNF